MNIFQYKVWTLYELNVLHSFRFCGEKLGGNHQSVSNVLYLNPEAVEYLFASSRFWAWFPCALTAVAGRDGGVARLALQSGRRAGRVLVVAVVAVKGDKLRPRPWTMPVKDTSAGQTRSIPYRLYIAAGNLPGEANGKSMSQ